MYVGCATDTKFNRLCYATAGVGLCELWLRSARAYYVKHETLFTPGNKVLIFGGKGGVVVLPEPRGHHASRSRPHITPRLSPHLEAY